MFIIEKICKMRAIDPAFGTSKKFGGAKVTQ
jgi:hypothetical protein